MVKRKPKQVRKRLELRRDEAVVKGKIVKVPPKLRKTRRGGGGTRRPVAIKTPTAKFKKELKQQEKEKLDIQEKEKLDLQEQQKLKKEAAGQISKPTITSRTIDTKTGMTRTTAEVSQSQFIRAGKVRNLSSEVQLSRRETTPQANLSLVDQVQEQQEQVRIKQEKATRFGGRIPLPVGEVVPQSIIDIFKEDPNQKFGKQPIIDLQKKFPKTHKAASTIAVGAVAFALTRKLPLSVTSGTLFRTGERAVGTAFIGGTVAGFQQAESKSKFLIETGVDLALFGAGGLGAVKGPKLFSTIKRVGKVKLEQAQINTALELEGGKIVTKDFFKLADVGKVEVTGDVLLSAKGRTQEITTPFGTLTTKEFIPKTEPVKVTIDPRKPPIPSDFLFKGTVRETVEFRELASKKPGLTTERLIFTQEKPIKGFGFGGQLELASKPFKSFRTDPGTPGLIGGRTQDINIQFTSTKLSRSRAVEPIRPRDPFKTQQPSPLKPTQIELKVKELGIFEFKKQPKGTLAFTEKGRIFAPKGINLQLGIGKRPGAFLDVKPTTKGLTPQQKVQRFPLIVRKVKLTPSKPKPVKKGTIEIFITKDVPTSQGQVLQQFQKVAVLTVPQKLKQKVKQKLKLKQKVKTKQTVAQAVLQKQKVKQVQQPKIIQELKLKPRQEVKQIPKIKLVQAVIQKPVQKQKPVLSQIPKQVISITPVQEQKPIVDVKLSQRLRLKPLLKPVLEPVLLTETVTPKLTQRIKPRPPTKPPTKIKLPELKLKKKKSKQDGFKLPSRTFKFTPSLVALEGRIKGKRPDQLTGFEVRKIPIGF